MKRVSDDISPFFLGSTEFRFCSGLPADLPADLSTEVKRRREAVNFKEARLLIIYFEVKVQIIFNFSFAFNVTNR